HTSAYNKKSAAPDPGSGAHVLLRVLKLAARGSSRLLTEIPCEPLEVPAFLLRPHPPGLAHRPCARGYAHSRSHRWLWAAGRRFHLFLLAPFRMTWGIPSLQIPAPLRGRHV